MPKEELVEVWHNLGDGMGCDECASYDGKTVVEVVEMNPMNPDIRPGSVCEKCRCWSAMEPRDGSKQSETTTLIVRGPDGASES